jgi:parallel beta-helix repeat protein
MPLIDRTLEGPRSRLKGKLLATFIASAIVVSFVATVLTLTSTVNDAPAQITYTAHNPILINDSADFASQAFNESWSGDGIPGTPYIIEGWDIDAYSTHGISISNSNVHFIIRGCYIEGGEDMYRGIYLYNCTNGTVTGNVCIDNYDGIGLEASCGNIISNNTLDNEDWDDEYGISLWSSSNNNTVIDNNCSDCDEGLYLFESSNNTLVNNTCGSNNDCGIYLEMSSYNNTLCNNTCNSNDDSGIHIELSSNNTLSNNTCSNNNNNGINLLFLGSSNNTLVGNNCSFNFNGIYLFSTSNDNTLSNNTCNSNNQAGIYLYSSSNNTLNNNTCSNNGAGDGMYVSSSNYNTISNNTCSNNTYGFTIVSSNNNTFSNNTCSLNLYEGMWFTASSNNTIWNNTFYHNNGAGDSYSASHIQAFDDGTNNRWNSTDGYGNWWSDWRSPDIDMNGIVDKSYNVSGGAANDSYPQTNAQWIPEFSEVVIPIAGLMLIALVFGRARKK